MIAYITAGTMLEYRVTPRVDFSMTDEYVSRFDPCLLMT